MQLSIQFFVSSVAVGLALQSFTFILWKLFKHETRENILLRQRTPKALTLLYNKWYYAGYAVIPLFVLSTMLSLLTTFLNGNSSLELLGVNIVNIPFFSACVLSLAGWMILTWIFSDILVISAKERVRRLLTTGQFTIILSSIVLFYLVGLLLACWGIFSGSFYITWSGYVLILTGSAYLILWRIFEYVM